MQFVSDAHHEDRDVIYLRNFRNTTHMQTFISRVNINKVKDYILSRKYNCIRNPHNILRSKKHAMSLIGSSNNAERSRYEEISFSVKFKAVRQPPVAHLTCGIKPNTISCKLNIGCIYSNQSIHSNGDTHATR
jgi:hypothetical protein